MALLSQLWDILSTIGDAIVNVLKALVMFVLTIPKYLTFSLGCIALMPSLLVGFLIFGVTACIILFFIGRQS